ADMGKSQHQYQFDDFRPYHERDRKPYDHLQRSYRLLMARLKGQHLHGRPNGHRRIAESLRQRQKRVTCGASHYVLPGSRAREEQMGWADQQIGDGTRRPTGLASSLMQVVVVLALLFLSR